MLGVVGVGAYAVYRLVKSEPTPSFPSHPDDTPLLNLPTVPGVVAPPAGSTAITGDLAGLRVGGWYAGRVETINAQGAAETSAFRPDADAQALTQALTALGFAGAGGRADAPDAGPPTVQVYMNPSAAAPHLPGYALASPGRGTRWFYGRWVGGTSPRPSAMVLLLRSVPPSTVPGLS
jgi:hypothetical protein